MADTTTRHAGPKTGEVYSTRLWGVKAGEADARTNGRVGNPSFYRGFASTARRGAADRSSPGIDARRPMERDCTLYFPEQAAEPLACLPGPDPGSELESLAPGTVGAPATSNPEPETGSTHARGSVAHAADSVTGSTS